MYIYIDVSNETNCSPTCLDCFLAETSIQHGLTIVNNPLFLGMIFHPRVQRWCVRESSVGSQLIGFTHQLIYPLVVANIAMERSTHFLSSVNPGKPSISMGHGFQIYETASSWMTFRALNAGHTADIYIYIRKYSMDGIDGMNCSNSSMHITPL